MGTLLWVRHGQASLFSANYDELSERGRQQATSLGQHFARIGWRPDVVFSGPAQRQLDTAALVADAAGAWPDRQTLAGLDEHDAFGMLKRALPKLHDDPNVVAAQAQLAAADTPAGRSGGFQRLFEAVMTRWLAGEIDAQDAETWPAFRQRVDAAITEMIAAAPSGAKLVAVSSVGPLAVALQRALHTDDATSFRTAWRCRNASIASFVFRRGTLTLDGYNVLPHLPDPADQTFR
jgi:broad specificity phosphatase PhoE